MNETGATYERPLRSGMLERELDRAVGIGVIKGYSMHKGSGPKPRRRWLLTFPNGQSQLMEATQVEAFCLGALIASEVTT